MGGPTLKAVKATKRPRKPKAPPPPKFELVPPVGRPRIVFTPEQVKTLEQLAAIDCTMEEIAAVMDCSEDTLRNNYSGLIEKGRHNGKASIKRAQFRTAVQKDNVTMQIWLGKVKLGQSEVVVDATRDGKTRKPQLFRFGGQVIEY